MTNAAILLEVVRVYEGSDGDATKALYERLTNIGPMGIIATNVFRANKNSARAKVYRGGIKGQGSYKSMAYDRKQWAMGNLCKVLSEHGPACGITWGWGIDKAQAKHRDVLYIDIPTGQVSFHTEARLQGPDYSGAWDGVRGASPDRICRWVSRLLEENVHANPQAA